MFLRHTVIKDCFGRHFRLHTPSDPPVHVAVEPESFWDLVLTEQFVRYLRVPANDWRYLLSRYDSYSGMDQGTGNAQDITTEARISQLLIQGFFKFYPLTHLNGATGAKTESYTFPIIQAEKGLSYQLVPASVLLVSTPPKIKEFNNIEEANHFITSLKIDDDQLAMLVHDLDLHVANGAQDHAKLLSALSQAMVERKAVVIVHQQSAAPPPKSNLDGSPTQGPGNKLASLGPHEGGDESETKKNTYKSQDEAAKAALENANPQSIKDNLEYGGVIYRDKVTGEYGYTGPIKGSDQGVNPFSEEIPPGSELVGDYHTHADYSIVDKNTGAAIRTSNPLKDDFNSDNFSPDDFSGIKAVGKGIDGYKGYLGTPSGKFKVFNPSTGMTNIL